MIKKPKRPGYKYTKHIRLLERGHSDTGQRFCKLLIHGDKGDETLLVRENHLEDYKAELEAKGANLVSPEAWRELTRRIQAHGLKEPTLKVATRIEIRDDAMALPGGPYPRTKSFEVALTDVPLEIQAKYSVAGDLDGWLKLTGYGRGNSRMILAFSLAFLGPLSAVTTIEHVGVQLNGPGGEGKSGISVIASSAWGWDPNPTVADRNGFGQNWNSTVNAVERTLCGYNQAFMPLNETGVGEGNGRKWAATILKAILKIEGSVGKARLNDPVPMRFWFAPLLSTSNKSVVELVRLAEGKGAGDQIDPAYLDRLADVPPPEGGHGMFETLHGFADVAAFVAFLKVLAANNHGVAARIFVRRLLKARRKDPKKLAVWIEKRRRVYIKRASAQIFTEGRNLTRLHGKFASTYAAGRLAASFGVLPYDWEPLLNAILKCEQDHVCFVERELNSGGTQPQSHLERLRDYIRAHQASFVDLDKKGVVVRDSAFKAAPGFVAKHKGKLEYLFAAEKFDEILGGRGPAERCKRTLLSRGHIATGGAGSGEIRFVVKRRFGEKRRWVVAIGKTLMDEVTPR